MNSNNSIYRDTIVIGGRIAIKMVIKISRKRTQNWVYSVGAGFAATAIKFFMSTKIRLTDRECELLLVSCFEFLHVVA